MQATAQPLAKVAPDDPDVAAALAALSTNSKNWSE
jgi:hypothetical protein